MSFQILGTGSALPACRKTNDDLSQLVDTSDEWITTRTGIKAVSYTHLIKEIMSRSFSFRRILCYNF